ncbi:MULTISPECIES: sarcosine oxidase subunit delta [Acetobacter]|uniref:Sarcosine oxidase delta subunit n=1 Tax=Acetobacter cibinongensis TaxID=146475 RepID=A0A1Z5YX49_9PROT|nr:sarcosine oxidase subunit delta [Acetobacter cibinongensis]OUJ03901.1 sarcosine oxidase subunit delta [Acetobacter cibinongensis]GAN61497.1 sarcosine oxidase delta subunit [Acetobacter cibinongensis]GBQ14304.1 sarcosine oxidase delta subunit [Acetobacter cibinongensis NRIC 0482]GEL59633.1 sarcosine oxidase subunit delta [Acetobacter cibinongensis]
MLLIECPYCGPRAEIEFSYGGEAHIDRPGPEVSEEEWASFLYLRENTKGVLAERWRHAHGCGRFFNALRDTRTDEFKAFYEMGEKRPDAEKKEGEGA